MMMVRMMGMRMQMMTMMFFWALKLWFSRAPFMLNGCLQKSFKFCVICILQIKLFISRNIRKMWKIILDILFIKVYLPSLFIAESKHFFNLQALHWLRCVLSIGHLPLNSPCALQVYTLPRWMLLLKNPEQPLKINEIVI